MCSRYCIRRGAKLSWSWSAQKLQGKNVLKSLCGLEKAGDRVNANFYFSSVYPCNYWPYKAWFFWACLKPYVAAISLTWTETHNSKYEIIFVVYFTVKDGPIILTEQDALVFKMSLRRWYVGGCPIAICSVQWLIMKAVSLWHWYS